MHVVRKISVRGAIMDIGCCKLGRPALPVPVVSNQQVGQTTRDCGPSGSSLGKRNWQVALCNLRRPHPNSVGGGVPQQAIGQWEG